MRSLNPACKFIGLLIPTFFLAAKHDPIVNLIVFGICMVGIIGSRVRFRTLLIAFFPILLAAVGMFFSGWRFSGSDSLPVNAAKMHIGSSALWNGMTLSSRVLVYAGIGYLFALTTDRIRMVESFRKQLRLPPIFAYGLLAAWGILPHMIEEYRRTKASFEARGKRVCAVSPSLLKPLLVKSVRWSEQLSQAMESKGFDGYAKRTMLDPPKVRRRDVAFCTVTCLIFPIILLLQ